MGRLDDQVVIVTGAGGGIGREHALLAAAEGAKVVVNDYNGDAVGNAGTSGAAQAVTAEIERNGGTAVADTHDVSTDGGRIVETALSTFGGLHAVVNNAGIAGGGPFDAIPPLEFDRMLDVHLGGTRAVCRAAFPVLREQGYGRIVNTSSVSVFGLPGSSAYATAKASILGLTRSLATEGREHGILVNAVMPSAYSRLTASSPEFAELMRAAFPAELVAPFVCALLSADAPVTGETFVVGGGRAARVVLGVVPGATGLTTVDTALARFDEVMGGDITGPADITVPADAAAEVADECARLGLDLQVAGDGR